MTDQVVWSGETRTEVSKLVVATNELTSKVITLLNAISGNFDGLVEQLEEATSAVNGGVADLSIIKADIEGSIRRAQEDMGNIYQSFLAESSDIKSSLSGLSTEADDLQLIMTTLNNTGTMLADKYNLLNATAAEVGNSVLLYKNQAGTIQESILSVESRAATISANLDRISEMAQVNTESSEEFMKEIANMQIEVYQLSSSVMEYKELADSLVENYTNLKQVAAEAQTMATAAHNDAVNATDKITAIADQYGDLSGTVESIKTLISEYNSIAADITSQLSSSSGELTAMRSTINDFSDFISSTISTVETNIATLISKVSSLTIKVDDLTSKVDSASETIYSIKSMVDIQLQDAIGVIANATNTASYIEGVVATNKTTVEDCLAVLGVAKTDTNLVLDNMTAYKAEVEQLYSDTMGHLSTVESNLAVLDGKTATVTEQLNSALSTLTSISEHVDGVSAHVDEIASTVETTYLKKVDQAVDSALLSGKAIDYFLHDDNRETKLSTSPTIQQMQTAISNINDVIQSDTGTLDTLQEIVDFIKLNKENLDNLTIGNIAGLQTALDGKLATDANAVSASKWVAARKITLGGALTGSVDVDGGSDVILNASIVSINDVPGLVDAMADKLDKNAAVADSSKLGGIDAARFFFGDTSANVKAILSADLDGLSQSGFYRVTDANQSVVYIHGDADSAVRITYDYATSHLYYKEKVSGVWSATSFKVLSDASRLDFTKLDNVPVFAPDVHTHLWADIADKPTVFAPDVHTHLWADITDKPTTFTPGVHSHYWDDILSKPTTFLAAPHDHYSVVSEGLLAEVSGTESITYPGVSMVEAKASNKYVVGTKEGTVLNLKGDAQSQLMVSGNSGAKPSLLIRSKSYDVDAIWSEWVKVFSSQDAPTWSDIASKPTTLAGFGITDGAPLSHVGAGGTAHSEASTSVAGFMSAADKTKLDGIAAGANAYVHPTGDGNLHVPVTGTNSDGYVLKAGATDGSMAWGQLTAADVGALPSTWVPDFSDISSKPTTLAGYGITDAQPLNLDLTAIAELAGTSGLLKKTAANTWSLDTNTYITENQSITISGDATGSGTTAIALTLADSGATAGTYKSVTVDSKGRVTSGTNPTTLAEYGITHAAPSSHVGSTGTEHGVVTTSVAGFMSAADKTKLDGIAAGANNYVHPTGNGNLHVPSNSGISQGACLASGSTAGALTWVSSIWRSYGITQIAKTTNNTNLYVNQYTKFLTVTITNRYQDYTTELTAMSGGSGTANNQNSRLNIRVKQQTDFGTDPFIEVFQTQLTPVDRQRYFYSIVQNTPTTIVDFYVMNVESWNHIGLFIQNDLQNGGSVNYLSNQAYTATLPANAVEFSKNRLLTESYHPLADALTTARTLTWTGDATGAMTFNGSANVSSALTLAATGVTAGTYRLVTVDAKGRVTWGANPTTLAGYGITDAAPSSHVGATGTAHGVATTSVAGFMSAADKAKLDGIISGGNVNTASTTNVPNLGSIAFVSRTISANSTVPTINYGDWVAGSAFKVASINGGSATQACTGTWKALSYFVGVGGNSSEVIQYGLAIRVE